MVVAGAGVESGGASLERASGVEVGSQSTCNDAEGLAALGFKARARCSSGASAVSVIKSV